MLAHDGGYRLTMRNDITSRKHCQVEHAASLKVSVKPPMLRQKKKRFEIRAASLTFAESARNHQASRYCLSTLLSYSAHFLRIRQQVERSKVPSSKNERHCGSSGTSVK